MIWLQLKTARMLEIRGVPTHFKPGDWVEVGKHTATRWIAEGIAHTPKPLTELIPAGSGIVYPAAQGFGSTLSTFKLPMMTWDQFRKHGDLPFQRTLFIGSDKLARPMLLPVGFNLLTKWQMVCPLHGYTSLAGHFGSEAERKKTEAIIRDLRVVVYEPHLLYVRRNKTTEEFMRMYLAELDGGKDRHLSFMRVLYQIKPQICATPASWLDTGAGA